MFQKVGFWQSIISATAAIALLKISIALNLLRLSQSRWYVWALWSSISMYYASFTVDASSNSPKSLLLLTVSWVG
jgi:anti-sigma-K factor RskA